jgi:hypothetical protein
MWLFVVTEIAVVRGLLLLTGFSILSSEMAAKPEDVAEEGLMENVFG